MKISTYDQAKEYLESFIRPILFQKITVKDGQQTDPLERMRVLLSLLGNPHEQFPSVLVSGTSGKGSTAYLLSHMLTSAGYKTGLTISPHLEKITERIQVNGKMVSDSEFVALVNHIQPVITKMQAMSIGEPSYFEILLALAFLSFAQQHVDIAVVEVGIEGKYDATNVLSPLVFILTNISLDHTKILGETVEAIAREATAVINKKENGATPVVITGVEQPAVWDIVRQKCQQEGVRLLRKGQDFSAMDIKQTETGLDFVYKNKEHTFPELFLSLRGRYQVDNATVALTAMLQLKQFGFAVSEEQMRRALSTAFFPGRFEVLSDHNQQIILDGAHNVAKMTAFIDSLRAYYPHQRFVFLIGFKQDKDIRSLLQILLPLAETIIVTQFAKETDMSKQVAMPADKIRAMIPDDVAVEVIPDSNEALQRAKKCGLEEHTPMVVTGSLYLVGEIRALLY